MYKISELINLISQGSTTQEQVSIAKESKLFTINGKEFDLYIEKLKSYLNGEIHIQGESIFLSLLVSDINKTFRKIRRDGILKASKYNFNDEKIKKLTHTGKIFLKGDNSVEYHYNFLNSVQALTEASKNIKTLKSRVADFANQNRTNFLKTLLTLINEFFSNRSTMIPPDSPMTETDFASAFSYIIGLDKSNLLQKKWWNNVNDLTSPELYPAYISCLFDSHRIVEFLDLETKVHNFEYSASYENEKLEVRSIENSLEKSIRLGYVQADIQRLIRVERLSSANNTIEQSIEDIINKLPKSMIRNFCDKPKKKKITFNFNNFYQYMDEIITHDFLSVDEMVRAMDFDIDSYQKTADLKNLSINDDFKVLDIIILMRVFAIIDSLMNKDIMRINDRNYRHMLAVNSKIFEINEDTLLKILSYFLSSSQINKIIKILTLDNSEKFIDIQYKPLLKLGSTYLIAPALISKSNLIRAIQLRHKQSCNKQPEKDLMLEKVAKELKNTGFIVLKEFNFKMGKKVETDILCFKDGHLFIFECKHSYHPCSTHELRTSYDLINKAAKQLSYRKEWLSDERNQKQLFEHFNLKCEPTKNIHTAIITANRMFSGYNAESNPVRQAHEFINVIKSGNLLSIDGKKRKSFWKDDTFQVDDLITYLNSGSIIKEQLDRLIPYIKLTKLDSFDILFHSYNLPLE